MEKEFYCTKGFHDAKEKLLQNRVVVIKGNTGDGKTATAVRLLHWLSLERQTGQPLQIHNIEKLDLLTPNSKLITFIDDIFGEKDVRKREVHEWNKRIFDLKSLFVNVEANNNFLLITIRNEIFNVLKKGSCEAILTENNIIDLSLDTYKVEEEKMGLLDLYKPENFSWTEEEIDEILTCAPNIGFPQCCQLFHKSQDLQKERSRFFEKPFLFLNEALSKLQECSALLYLFFNDGMIRIKDLDPNGQNVNKELLEEAFDINLIPGEDDSTKLSYKKKVVFVKESLEKLLGFLVVKETPWWSEEDVYRFHHDSIYVAVALLYGKATPVGYIQNCPSNCLSYLTTSKTVTNMIVLSSDYFTDMCERLLREFECKTWYEYSTIGYVDFWKNPKYDTSAGSLDVWNDPEFFDRFTRFLNERKIDKLIMLNKACGFGAEECALYLLSEGVKPEKDTALSLVGGDWNDGNRQVCLIKKIGAYLNDETKLAVLNKACESAAEECALYFLCEERVKPDKDTVFGVVEGGSMKLLRKLMEHDITPLAMHGDCNVLYWACLHDREEMVILLCNTYPHFVLYTDNYGVTPLYDVVSSGTCGLFQMIERIVLNSLYRVENQETKCESVDGYAVHKNCVCAQYISQLVGYYGMTVLHHACRGCGGDGLFGEESKELCLYLCRSYPGLIPIVDEGDCNCLHYIARYTSDVDFFSECETYVKQYVESTGGKYDVTTILNDDGKSALDLAKERAGYVSRGIENNPYFFII